MEQQQVSNFIPPADIPLKRRRGRPRKDPSLIPSRRASFPLSNKDQTPNHGENAPIPPGFEQTNGNQPQTSTVNDSNSEDAMVGKVVTGVIEASFEAGYLLSVQVGESETSLRGIVFKPGHYVPVSSENDVAPTLQMIGRNEVPIPSVSPVKKRRGRKRTEPVPNSAPPNQLPIVPFQPSHSLGSRGTVVPVVLQPVNLSNGATPAVEATPVAIQPAHLAASIAKPVPLSHATMEVTVPKNSHTDSGLGSLPFEELVSAAKRMRGSESVETQNEKGITANKNLPNDSSISQEQVEDLSEPLTVKPLQAIRSGFSEQSASLSHAFPERRTGKMTELLLAVQENLKERQMGENHQEFKSAGN